MSDSCSSLLAVCESVTLRIQQSLDGQLPTKSTSVNFPEKLFWLVSAFAMSVNTAWKVVNIFGNSGIISNFFG